MSRLRSGGLAALLALVLASLGVGSSASAATENRAFNLRSVEVQEVDGVYLLDAVARLRLPPAVRRALHGGVGLVVSWQVEIFRGRDWWLDADVASVNQHYRLEYHELSLQYLVTTLNTGERRSFVDLKGALAHIGRLYRFPLIDQMVIASQPGYRGRVQVRLDHGALPWALRPTVLFSTAWDLHSQWREWSFE